MSQQICVHPTLRFSSGDYYVGCVECGATWMRKGDRPEYGKDLDGKEIGADPSKAQAGFSQTTYRIALTVG